MEDYCKPHTWRYHPANRKQCGIPEIIYTPHKLNAAYSKQFPGKMKMFLLQGLVIEKCETAAGRFKGKVVPLPTSLKCYWVELHMIPWERAGSNPQGHCQCFLHKNMCKAWQCHTLGHSLIIDPTHAVFSPTHHTLPGRGSPMHLPTITTAGTLHMHRPDLHVDSDPGVPGSESTCKSTCKSTRVLKIHSWYCNTVSNCGFNKTT